MQLSLKDKKYSRCIATLLLAAIFLNAYSQKNIVRFKQITVNEGLSSNFVNCFLQDRKGFMWIGTRDGLNRFDGNEFKIFRYNPDDTNSLSSNIIESIFEDNNGYLWIGTHEGLNILKTETGEFIRLMNDPYNSNSLCYNETRDVVQTNDSTYWIATYGGGIDKLVITFKPMLKYQFTHYNSNLAKNFYISENHVNDLFIDSDNTLWAGLQRDGIIAYSVNDDWFYTPDYINSFKEKDTRATVNMINEDNEKNLWFGTWELGFFKVDKKLKTVKGYNFDKEKNNLFYNYIARCLSIDCNNNNIWLGSFGGGLIKFNKVTDEYIQYFNDPLRSTSLGHNIVWNLYIDNSGTLWVGTWGAGISQLDLNRAKFVHYTHEPDNPNSIAGNTVNNIFVDYTGKIWISTFESGISIFDKNTGKFSNLRYDPSNPQGLSTNTVWSVYVDPAEKGEIAWIATDVEFVRYNLKLNTFKKYKYLEANPNDPKAPSFTNTRSVFIDSYDTLWLTTWGGGLNKFDRKTENFTHYRHNPLDPHSISNDAVLIAFEDSYRNLWFGTSNSGLDLYDRKNQKFKHYRFDKNNPSGINSNNILCIFECKQKKLWIGTTDGLNLYKREDNSFTSYTVKNGFPNNTINSIEEDDSNNLWIGTNAGISCFNPSTGAIVNYDKYDGLENTYTLNASAKTADGYMLFGGTNGFDIFHPEHITKSQFTPPVAITNFRLFNRAVEINKEYNGKVLLTKTIEETKQIVLSHKHKEIGFDFASLHYPAPEKNLYKYKLEGFNDEWVFTNSSRRFAIFSNLEPGKYTFKVQGTNNDGVWNPNEATIAITVLPPFWKTWWFVLIASIAAIACILGLYYMRVRSILYHKNQLEKLVKERTLELEERNQEVLEQNEEIRNQADLATRQRDHISQQNAELELHRNHLEKLVHERTQELLEAKERAEEADRLKTAFLANMSHEIRTPMNSILGFINLLDFEDISEEERTQFKELINTNSQMLLHVIDDILDIAKIESGELKLKMVISNLNDILMETFSTFKEHEKIKNNTISLNILPLSDDTYIITDRIRLRQVINNLVDNAIKYTERGSINVNCKIENNSLIFMVKDTGIGISTDNLGIIFDRFRKIEGMTDKLYRGTGLGLSITKKIIEMLNGKIWVESEPEVGSTFYFTLPYQPTQLSGSIDTKPFKTNYTIPDLVGKTILIAEDEDSNYVYLQTLLKYTKATILRAKTGFEVVNAFQQGRKIDLIFMDIKLPEMNGIDATIKIKNSFDFVPVIAQTAFAMKEDRSKYLEMGFDAYISKPILKEELYNLLNQFFKL
ncbi:MAG: response regulator [Bacteroidales bacterium]|nr:response regulator [Bacteroidales bacterium]